MAIAAAVLDDSAGEGERGRTGGGRMEVVKASPGMPRTGGDVDIRRGTIYGNPFMMRGESERDDCVACYWSLLKGDRSAYELARECGLTVHEGSARVPHVHRIHALERLYQRVAAGGVIRLVCACAPRVCHGHVIKAWVERRMARGE
mmetsp:Transcript_61110/g.120918  ORF Transcript_61110/g.120918 Transcript_61110/m.120918 type:complete len:147 (-) Transcript_61110:35-475(-)